VPTEDCRGKNRHGRTGEGACAYVVRGKSPAGSRLGPEAHG